MMSDIFTFLCLRLKINKMVFAFDFDGTLSNTADIIVTAVNNVLKSLNINLVLTK